MLPPSRPSPTCHCHSDPDSQIKPSRKTARAFFGGGGGGQLNTKTPLPEAATKRGAAFEWRERREAPRSADSGASIHPGPSPHTAPTIAAQSQPPEEAEIENTFFIEAQLEFHEFHHSRLSQHFLERIL